ncbi:hypothetical protein FF1_043833 [Malus domestica]
MANFTSNPISLINEFVAILQRKNRTTENEKMITENSTAMLGKFIGFLAGSDTTTHDNIPDSGATDHITNKTSCLHEFQKLTDPTHVSVANGSSHSEEDW